MDDFANITTGIYKGEFFEKERKRYTFPPEDQTGFLQKYIEEKVQEEFQKRTIEQSDEMTYLRIQVETFDLVLEELVKRLERLEKEKQISKEIIEVRDIPMEQIKKEMLLLLSDSKTRYVDEIAMELKLDIKDVVEAFNQLQKEGKLSIDKDKL